MAFFLLCSRTRYASAWFAYLDSWEFGFSLSDCCDHRICISRMKNQEGHWRHCWCHQWVRRKNGLMWKQQQLWPGNNFPPFNLNQHVMYRYFYLPLVPAFCFPFFSLSLFFSFLSLFLFVLSFSCFAFSYCFSFMPILYVHAIRWIPCFLLIVLVLVLF